jgi:hypothetical protein
MVSMFNPRLTETLTDFPFARLNALIASIAPPECYIRVALVHDEKATREATTRFAAVL